jgi:thioester reductase-like protein
MPALEQVLKNRRILLTGSTGFLGKVFLAILLRWHPEI